MLKTVSLALVTFGLLMAGVTTLQSSPAKAETITCREAAKLKYPHDFKSRHAYRRACKAAWKAHKLNPQPLPPKA
jgi:hypothetical protein